MDERPWRKYLEPLRGLGIPISRSRQEEIELAENILTGAVPWAGPPSGETSKASLLDVRQLGGSPSQRSVGTSHPSREISQTRIEDRILDPRRSQIAAEGMSEEERQKVVSISDQRKTRGKTETIGKEPRKPDNSTSRYRLPKDQRGFSLFKLNRTGWYKCDCVGKTSGGQKSREVAKTGSTNPKQTTKREHCESRRPNDSPNNGLESETSRAETERNSASVSWSQTGNRWSHIANPRSESSWSHIRRGTSLADWKAAQPNKEASTSTLESTAMFNPYDVERYKSQLEQTMSLGTSDVKRQMRGVEQKLSLALDKMRSLLPEKVVTANDRLIQRLSKYQRIFIDVFLVVLTLIIFVSWFSYRYEIKLRGAPPTPLPPIPVCPACLTCGPTSDHGCSSCEHSFNPLRTVSQHIKSFTDAFIQGY